MFFNTPTRLKSLKSSSEEYAKIVAVVQSYAIHNSGISFQCKLSNKSSWDVNTLVNSSQLENISNRFGESLKKELVEMTAKNGGLGCEVNGWFSNSNFNAKKSTFLFFINRQSLFLCSLIELMSSDLMY